MVVPRNASSCFSRITSLAGTFLYSQIYTNATIFTLKLREHISGSWRNPARNQLCNLACNFLMRIVNALCFMRIIRYSKQQMTATGICKRRNRLQPALGLSDFQELFIIQFTCFYTLEFINSHIAHLPVFFLYTILYRYAAETVKDSLIFPRLVQVSNNAGFLDIQPEVCFVEEYFCDW